MLEEIPDNRTPVEKLDDYTDSKLADLYQARGIIGAGEDVSFSRENVLEMMRTAYWYGASDQRENPRGTKLAAKGAADYYDRMALDQN